MQIRDLNSRSNMKILQRLSLQITFNTNILKCKRPAQYSEIVKRQI